MSEPVAKKIKLSTENSGSQMNSQLASKSFFDTQIAIDFSDPSILHDRVLIVDGKKFYVNSQFLSQYSDFFTGLFSSNFKESGQVEIELKDLNASDFENFLGALYPGRTKVTENSLPGLMQLSCRFLCPLVWSYCLDFLRNKDEYKKLTPRNLFLWAEGSDSVEFKTMIENHIIEDNSVIKRPTMQYLVECLTLSDDYGLENLKNDTERFLLMPTSLKGYPLSKLMHYSDVYELDELKKKVGKLLDKVFDKLIWDKQLEQAMRDLLLDGMNIYKEKTKTNLLMFVENYREHDDDRNSQFMNDVFVKRKDPKIMSNVESILIEIFYDEEKKTEHLEKYLTICQRFNLYSVKFEIEENLIGYSRSEYEIDYLLLLVEKFGLEGVRMCLDVQLYHFPANLQIDLAFLQLCDLPNLTDKVDRIIDRQLQEYSDKNIFLSFERNREKWSEELEKLVVEFLIKRLIKAKKPNKEVATNMLKIAAQYDIPQLKVGVSSALEIDFANKNSLKFMNLAFVYNLVGLKDLIAAYLLNVNSSELSEEDKIIIIRSPNKIKDVALRHLFNV